MKLSSYGWMQKIDDNTYLIQKEIAHKSRLIFKLAKNRMMTTFQIENDIYHFNHRQMII